MLAPKTWKFPKSIATDTLFLSLTVLVRDFVTKFVICYNPNLSGPGGNSHVTPLPCRQQACWVSHSPETWRRRPLLATLGWPCPTGTDPASQVCAGRTAVGTFRWTVSNRGTCGRRSSVPWRRAAANGRNGKPPHRTRPPRLCPCPGRNCRRIPGVKVQVHTFASCTCPGVSAGTRWTWCAGSSHQRFFSIPDCTKQNSIFIGNCQTLKN